MKKMNKVIYNRDFYLELSEREGTKSAAKVVVPILLNILKKYNLLPSNPKVADFGCGPGIWLNSFKENGCKVQGYDGGNYKEYYRISEYEFSNVNLTERIDFEGKFDVAVSLEVAEHIDERKSASFLENLINAADYIMFSAAIPLQLGQGHVNEQWPSYWVKRFKELGYVCLDIIRPIIWGEEYSNIDFFYQQNILLFVRDTPKNRAFIEENERPVYDLVHPRQWEKIHTWIPVKIVVALYNNPYTYRLFEKWKKYKRHRKW